MDQALHDMPAISATSFVEDSRLAAVLPGLEVPPLPVTLLYPNRRHLPRRVRAFMDWLVAQIGPYLDH